LNQQILLIDEDPNFLEAFAYLLRHEGYDITLAYNGQLGFQKAEPHHFSLIVTDLMMPDYDGLRLIKRLRSCIRFREKPIFVVTAHQDHAAEAISAGATQVFHKPLHFDSLLHSLRQVIAESS
jgi:DNA-binding response OmpR family regulator